MKIGDMITTKKNYIDLSYIKGGLYLSIGKRGNPWVPVRSAGVFVRNKYRSSGDWNNFTSSRHQSAFFGIGVQCYGEHRFQPGEVIGEVVNIQDSHIDVILDSSTFDPDLEIPFKVAIGIALDKNTLDAFESAEEAK